ncbi:CobQ/CobB/MinD/ParA nucleotide binding domain protein [compost metagenome]
MIAAVTSKRGGTGSTTIAVLSSICLSKGFKRKVCLVDLQYNSDIYKILGVKRNQGIDGLITSLGFDNKDVKLEEHITNYDGLDVIQGTRVTLSTYLYKRSHNIKLLLDKLEDLYDVVILDMPDGELYEELLENGSSIFPLNVMEQNMLVVLEYQEEMRNGLLPGLVIVNKLDNTIFPEKNLFEKNFLKKSLYFLPYSDKVKNLLNLHTSGNAGKGIKLKNISTTGFYNGINQISSTLNQEINLEKSRKINETLDDELGDIILDKPIAVKKKKKKSIFSFLKKGGK